MRECVNARVSIAFDRRHGKPVYKEHAPVGVSEALRH
jgi:hypothetical protein